jgi:hypothetical protein
VCVLAACSTLGEEFVTTVASSEQPKAPSPDFLLRSESRHSYSSGGGVCDLNELDHVNAAHDEPRRRSSAMQPSQLKGGVLLTRDMTPRSQSQVEPKPRAFMFPSESTEDNEAVMAAAMNQ